MTVLSAISVGRSASLGARQRRIDSVVIVTVDLFDVPAARLELGGNIVGEGDFRAAVDGDAIIVIKQDQLAGRR